MRALFRFLRSRPGRSPSRSKTRRIASATRMYSPSSTRANSQIDVGLARHGRGAAADAHLEARDLFAVGAMRFLAMKPRSWKWRAGAVVGAVGERGLELARQALADGVAQHVARVGRRARAWCRRPRPAQMPAKGQPVMLRTVWAQASRVVRPAAPMMRMTSAASSRLTKWNWKFSRVVMWPRWRPEYFSRDLGQGVHLVGGDAAVGQLDAHHLVVFLALAVGAARQAEELEGRSGPRRRCGTSWPAPRTRRSRRKSIRKTAPGLSSGILS